MTQISQSAGYVVRIRQLLALYFQQFPGDQLRLNMLSNQVLSDEVELCNRRTMPGHLTGSAFVLDCAAENVLLLRHIFLQRWLQPGGHLEADEHPADGARREMVEEAGVSGAVLHSWHGQNGIPLDIDSHRIPENIAKGEPEHVHHDWIYVFVLPAQAVVELQADEVSNHKWVPLADFASGEYGQRLIRCVARLDALNLLAAAQ